MTLTFARLFQLRVYVIQGNSMSPTIKDGQHLVVRSVGTSVPRLPRRSLVIVQDRRGPEPSYVKRVVGLPGETVSIQDGLLFVDGAHLDEPYLGRLPASLGLGEASWEVGPAEFFVMGDNRHRSTDSRTLGPIPSALIEGRVVLRYWPLRRFGRVS